MESTESGAVVVDLLYLSFRSVCPLKSVDYELHQMDFNRAANNIIKTRRSLGNCCVKSRPKDAQILFESLQEGVNPGVETPRYDRIV